MKTNDLHFTETNIFFETFLVSNHWARLLEPIRIRLFFINIFVALAVAGVLMSFGFDLIAAIQDSRARIILILAAILVCFTTTIFHFTNHTKKHGVMKIYADRVLVVEKEIEHVFLFEKIDNVRFERHSTFHRASFFEIPLEHGNKFFVEQRGKTKEYEFQLNSKEASSEFFELMKFISRNWGHKVSFTSI